MFVSTAERVETVLLETSSVIAGSIEVTNFGSERTSNMMLRSGFDGESKGKKGKDVLVPFDDLSV